MRVLLVPADLLQGDGLRRLRGTQIGLVPDLTAGADPAEPSGPLLALHASVPTDPAAAPPAALRQQLALGAGLGSFGTALVQ